MTGRRCPSLEILTAYREGTLSASQRDVVEEHVAWCDACARCVRSEPVSGRDGTGEVPVTATYSGAVERVASPDGVVADQSESQPGSTLTMESGLGFIRDYQLLEVLGRGGMGIVYKAIHTQLERIVALKVVSPDRCQDAGALARFRREIKAAGKLNHPNVITAYDAGESAGKHYLVMEYVEGVDLGTLSRQFGCLPIADACELARQAAVAIKHIHKHSLIHRDIKPSNLMLTGQGRVKVLDLGLALLQTSGDQLSELTDRGGMMGTIDYMAPEQLDDSHGVDIRADIYSLGATLYKLLCGHAPYGGLRYTTVAQKINALFCKPFPPLRARRPQVSTELADVVQRMLRRRPADRYATPAEVVSALEPFASGSQLLEYCGRAGGDTHLNDNSTLELRRQSVESEAASATPENPKEAEEQDAAEPQGPGSPESAAWQQGESSPDVALEPSASDLLAGEHEIREPMLEPRRNDPPPVAAPAPLAAADREAIQAAQELMAKLDSDNSREFRKRFDLDLIRRHGKLPEPYREQLIRLIQEEILPLEKLGLKPFSLKRQSLTCGPHDTCQARWTWPDRRFVECCYVALCRRPPAKGDSPRDVSLAGSLQTVTREQFEGGGCLVIHPRSEWDTGYVVVWALVDAGFQSFFSEPLVLGRLQIGPLGPGPRGCKGGV
jgi:serine/threonine protein kinase